MTSLICAFRPSTCFRFVVLILTVGVADALVPSDVVLAQSDKSESTARQNTKQQSPATEFLPKQDKLPVTPPRGATVLFDGRGAHNFLSMAGDPIDWSTENGTLISASGKRRSNHLVSGLHFRDADIHVEFMLPEKGSGNSGVYIHGNYELQIFNSFGKKNSTKATWEPCTDLPNRW